MSGCAVHSNNCSAFQGFLLENLSLRVSFMFLLDHNTKNLMVILSIATWYVFARANEVAIVKVNL